MNPATRCRHPTDVFVRQHFATNLRGYFKSVAWAAPIPVGRQGRTEILIGVVEAHDLYRPYPQPSFAKP